MLADMQEPDLKLVLALERELRTKASRNDQARVLEMLAPDFTEVGASGRMWDLASTLELLASPANDDEEVKVSQLTGRMLAGRDKPASAPGSSG